MRDMAESFQLVSPRWLIAARLIMQRPRRPRAHLNVDLLPDVDQEQQTPHEGRQRRAASHRRYHGRSYEREPVKALKQVNRCPAGDPGMHGCFHAAGYFSTTSAPLHVSGASFLFPTRIHPHLHFI